MDRPNWYEWEIPFGLNGLPDNLGRRKEYVYNKANNKDDALFKVYLSLNGVIVHPRLK